jgi:hypothetical protein
MRDDEMSQIEFVFFFFFFFLLLIFLYLFFCFSFISVPSLSTEFPKFQSTALFSSFCCRKEAKDRKENRNELTKEEEEEGSSEKKAVAKQPSMHYDHARPFRPLLSSSLPIAPSGPGPSHVIRSLTNPSPRLFFFLRKEEK